MTTGKLPRAHGVVANGFYWRQRREVEMWTGWNECIQQPQIWDLLHQHDSALRTAVWFPLLSKGCGADAICTPAPIHNPDGSESLWCYTRPSELYGTLRDALGHFPLQHFWGPLANIRATEWICRSAARQAADEVPNFFYIYVPHLDYAAQRSGPDSPPARAALAELDTVLAEMAAAFHAAYGPRRLLWLVASEYAIVPVDQVVYPNRMLRQAGLLAVRPTPEGEQLDLEASRAWALVDHQFAHVFLNDPACAGQVADLFRRCPGIERVLVGDELGVVGLDHERSGELVLVSSATSWQAYYWWLDDQHAPNFARTVDIHRKPGYDPVELFFDQQTKGIPLDASLVRGSHGAPAHSAGQRGVLLSSQPGLLAGRSWTDCDVFELVLRQFGA
jgi:predicted AlkP superfamily pyrophosphatase or phosphodiesterase